MTLAVSYCFVISLGYIWYFFHISLSSWAVSNALQWSLWSCWQWICDHGRLCQWRSQDL